MRPEIKEAVQRAKTCATAWCEDEPVCFTLATEVERLCEELAREQITFAPPNYEATPPIWLAAE